ncbi:hypothetical protein PZA11_007691 [Diplocarpon coronariae]
MILSSSALSISIVFRAVEEAILHATTENLVHERRTEASPAVRRSGFPKVPVENLALKHSQDGKTMLGQDDSDQVTNILHSKERLDSKQYQDGCPQSEQI